jgi:hypothetical protein
VIHDGRQNRSMVGILEQGVYQLAFSSKLDSAQDFQRWVIEDVLPSIQQTGSYNCTTPPSPEAMFLEAGRLLLEHKHRLDNLEVKLQQTQEEFYYRTNPRQGTSIYRYSKSNLKRISINTVTIACIGRYMAREGYPITCSYIEELQYGNPVVKAYDIDAIEQAIIELISNGKLVMYAPLKGKLQLKWHTEYQKLKSDPKPSLFIPTKALLILFPHSLLSSQQTLPHVN